MSSSRKYLKIVSMVTLLAAVLCIVVVVLGFGDPRVALENAPFEMSADTARIVLSLAAGFGAGINLVLGLAGMRAANVPSRVGSACTLALIGLVVALVNVVLCFFQGFGVDMVRTISAVLSLACTAGAFVFANSVKKEYEAWH